MSSTADEQSDILEIKYPKHTQLNLSFMFVIVCGLFEWKQICAGFFFIVCVYMYCRWRSSYQERRVGDPVIKRRGLRSSYQEGRVEDPVIKRRVLRSSYQEGRVGIPLTCLTPPYFVPVPRHVGHGFPTSNGHMSWTQYSVSSVKMRGDSSFC